MVRSPDLVDECYKNKDLSLLKKLTLVIPTYNRNYYLSRCLWYHAHFPIGQIIIADSSSDAKKMINKETVAIISNLFDTNITYLDIPDESDSYGGVIYKKWNYAASHVNTPYAQNCTDKEFIIPTTSCKCIEILEKNPDVSVAEGMNYQLSLDEDGLEAFYPWAGNASFPNNSPWERVKESLSQSGNIGMQFSVQRSDNFKAIYKGLELYHLFDIRFGETAIELSPLLQGKTEKLQSSPGNIRDLLSLKSTINGVRTYNKAESSSSRYPLISDYPKERYDYLHAELTKYLSSISSEKISDSEIETHIDFFLQKRYQHKQGILNKSQSIRKLVEKVWHMQSKSFQDKLRKILGEKMLAPAVSPMNEPTAEMLCIKELVDSTISLHTNDSVIFDILSKY